MNLEGEHTEAQIRLKGNNNAMEVDVNNDEIYSDEEWSTHEPGRKKYFVTRIVKCRDQNEWQLEEELETQFVAVKGVVYEPGEWLDPGWRSIKDELPQWL